MKARRKKVFFFFLKIKIKSKQLNKDKRMGKNGGKRYNSFLKKLQNKWRMGKNGRKKLQLKSDNLTWDA